MKRIFDPSVISEIHVIDSKGRKCILTDVRFFAAEYRTERLPIPPRGELAGHPHLEKDVALPPLLTFEYGAQREATCSEGHKYTACRDCGRDYSKATPR